MVKTNRSRLSVAILLTSPSMMIRTLTSNLELLSSMFYCISPRVSILWRFPEDPQVWIQCLVRTVTWTACLTSDVRLRTETPLLKHWTLKSRSQYIILLSRVQTYHLQNNRPGRIACTWEREAALEKGRLCTWLCKSLKYLIVGSCVCVGAWRPANQGDASAKFHHLQLIHAKFDLIVEKLKICSSWLTRFGNESEVESQDLHKNL